MSLRDLAESLKQRLPREVMSEHGFKVIVDPEGYNAGIEALVDALEQSTELTVVDIVTTAPAWRGSDSVVPYGYTGDPNDVEAMERFMTTDPTYLAVQAGDRRRLAAYRAEQEPVWKERLAPQAAEQMLAFQRAVNESVARHVPRQGYTTGGHIDAEGRFHPAHPALFGDLERADDVVQLRTMFDTEQEFRPRYVNGRSKDADALSRWVTEHLGIEILPYQHQHFAASYRQHADVTEPGRRDAIQLYGGPRAGHLNWIRGSTELTLNGERASFAQDKATQADHYQEDCS